MHLRGKFVHYCKLIMQAFALGCRAKAREVPRGLRVATSPKKRVLDVVGA